MENEISTNNKVYGKTFFWMFLGLLGSGIIAYYTYASNLFYNIIVDGYFEILLVLELVAVFIFNVLFKKLPPVGVGILYFVYAMLDGVTLSVIFAVFELDSIIVLFAISALAFAALSFIGYKTNKDLSSWGTYISVFLIAGIVLSLLNLFVFKNSMFDLILDWVILALFCGVTIYDINKIKNYLLSREGANIDIDDSATEKSNAYQLSQNIDIDKIHIYFAMDLYLDFVNIFLRILSIFGKRRD